jgi:hypothetical protein
MATRKFRIEHRGARCLLYDNITVGAAGPLYRLYTESLWNLGEGYPTRESHRQQRPPATHEQKLHRLVSSESLLIRDRRSSSTCWSVKHTCLDLDDRGHHGLGRESPTNGTAEPLAERLARCTRRRRLLDPVASPLALPISPEMGGGRMSMKTVRMITRYYMRWDLL